MKRVIASLLVAGCGTTTYEIPHAELERLALTQPQDRGQHVRVVQQLAEADVGPPAPVEWNTQLVFFPEPNVYGEQRRRYVSGGGSWGGNGNFGNGSVPHHSAGGLHLGGGGGDGKAEAIVILAAAAIVLVAAAAIEGSRYDGFAQLHPMQPVHLFGKDGGYVVMPLAWIDPDTAAWTDHAIINNTEGPWRPLGRAPLDREGWTYALLGGIGTYKSVDGSVADGTATSIQLGYFVTQKVGIVGTLFLGWRDNAVGQTLFESRYTVEVQGYPVQLGPVHLGLYGGLGGASRFEDYGPGTYGDESTAAAVGGALVQLDIDTRLALTGRMGVTYAHDEVMSDALFGLSVY